MVKIDFEKANLKEKTYQSMQYEDAVSEYKRQIKDIGTLSREEEREYAIKARNGNESAREMLILHNLPYVITVAEKYRGRGLEFADLISEGNAGLIKAVESFDPSKGTKLITYARQSIEWSIKDALADSGGSIRLPRKGYTTFARIKVIGQKQPWRTEEDIAHEVASMYGIRKETIDDILASRRMLTLNVKMPSGSSISGEEFMAMKYPELRQEGDYKYLEPDIFEEVWASIPDGKNKEIIRMRFGLYEHAPMELKEIGKIMHISSEAVRKRELKCKNNVRKNFPRLIAA